MQPLKSAAPRRPLALALCLILMAPSFVGCAQRSSTREIRLVAATAASLRYDAPAIAREPCAGAPLPGPNPGEPDYQVFGVLQTGQLVICDQKRQLALAAGDILNRSADQLVRELRPATGWERIFGKRKVTP